MSRPSSMSIQETSRAHARYSRIVTASLVGTLPIFSALLTTVYLWRGLAVTEPPQEVGLAVLCSQASIYLLYLQLGLDVASMLAMSGMLATERTAEAAAEYRWLRRFNRGMAVTVMALAMGIAAVSGNLPGVPPELSEEASWLVVMLGAAQACTFLSRPAAAAIVASNRILLQNWVTVTQSVLRFAFGYGAFLLGAGIYSLAAGELASQLVATVTLNVLASRICAWTGLRDDKPPPLRTGRLREGILISLGTIGWGLEAGCDVFVLQSLPGGLAVVAAYALWSRFPALAQAAVTAFVSNMLSPLKSTWVRDPKAARVLLLRVLLTHAGLCLIVASVLGMWLPAVVRLWQIGAEYELSDAATVSVLLATTLAARSFVHLMFNTAVAFGSLRLGIVSIWFCVVLKCTVGLVAAKANGITGLLTVGLFAWLVPFAAIGWRLAKMGGASVRVLLFGAAAVGSSYGVAHLLQPFANAETIEQLAVRLAATGVAAAAALAGWLLLTGTVPIRAVTAKRFLRGPLS
jgi:hypothetical protein